MALKKLEKLEKSLSDFRTAFENIKAERDSLRNEVEELKEANQNLIREKDSVKAKIDGLLSRIDELGL